MNLERILTGRTAVAQSRAREFLPQDGGVNAQWWAPFKQGLTDFQLPNFEWRRNALPAHDLHHVITGYPLNLIGEIQMSAWEFAAGKYPSIFATAFCLPLIVLGLLIAPRLSFRAYARGRRSQTLYSEPDLNDCLEKSVHELREQCLPIGEYSATAVDHIRYVLTVAWSASVVTLPIVTYATVVHLVW